MGLFRTVSEINGDFRRQSQFFAATRVFCAPAKRVPSTIGYQRWGQKTRGMGLPDRERSLAISSAMWIQSTNVTDRRTLDDSKDRAYA